MLSCKASIKKYTAAIFAAALILAPARLFAQEGIPPQKYALVIGNGAYTNLGPLANPINDANDVAAVLESLGFTVDKLLNANLEQMENSAARLASRLRGSRDSYGFFFYAGHGVQSNGENYLIPVDANIPSEAYLRIRTLSLQVILDDLSEARNSLNLIVLDACRDNPFNWSRSGSRGLVAISSQPARSIIVYATGAGQRASDGLGRNGLFTSQLLPNLAVPDIEVGEVFRRTGADVSKASADQQVPAIYSNFFGTAYLGHSPALAALPAPAALPEPAGEPPEPASGPIPAAAPGQGQTRPPTEPGIALIPTEPELAAPFPPGFAPGFPPEEGIDPEYFPLAQKSLFAMIGFSGGTTFSAPWITTTIHGTIPLNWFTRETLPIVVAIEAGLDYGLVSRVTDAKYFSLYPFIRLLSHQDYGSKFTLYSGFGVGRMFATYKFPTGDVKVDIMALDVVAGALFLNFLELSYSLRTNFKSVSNKVSLGGYYRFKR